MKMLVDAEPPRYSYEDYKHWGGEWELMGGYPFSLQPSPHMSHDEVVINFTVSAVEKLKRQEGRNCKLYNKIDWKIDDFNTVRPDAIIVCNAPMTDFLTKTPVLILEVESPRDGGRDRKIKYELYEAAGVRYYLLANYLSQKLSAFELINGRYALMTQLTFQLDGACRLNLDEKLLWEIA